MKYQHKNTSFLKCSAQVVVLFLCETYLDIFETPLTLTPLRHFFTSTAIYIHELHFEKAKRFFWHGLCS